MRRLRIVLLGVAIALGLPIALLAWRALDGLEMERAVRHQAVSERAFDEMERVLTGFLDVEEGRPFEAYARRLPDGRPSPLAVPSQPFVVGAFQIDPAGILTLPVEAQSSVAGDTVRRVVRQAFETRAGESAAPLELAQAPGTTRAVGGRLQTKRQAVQEAAPAPEPAAEGTAYEIFRNLNPSARERSKRRALAKQKSYADDAQADAAASASALEAEAPDAGAAAEAPSRAPQALARSELRGLGYAILEEAAEAPGEPGPALSLDAQLEPMLGRAAGDAHVVLYRTVLRNRQGYRQGLVIDTAALGDWLVGEVVHASGLDAYATVTFGPADAEGAGPGDAFQYRFAEPFDGLTVRMQIAGLPGASGPGAVHGLVALLAIVGAAGLLAIYRMVSVVVHFAERRNSFVAAVTHELKTPLTAIRMYGEMLRDDMVGDDGKRREYYRTITDESERLSRLIDNVLEFSRLERGAREMDWTVGAPGAVVRDVADRLRAHAARQGFSIETVVDPDLPAIRFDRDALVQVLFNLVDNAMKYSRGSEQRRIVLEARRREAGVAVAVRDFGPGVAGGHLARIFEPFYRGEDELTRTTKGTGIGLALVRDLVEQMGAAVVGRNAADGGFRVEIAFAPAGP